MTGWTEFAKELVEVGKKTFSLEEIPLRVWESSGLSEIPLEVGESVHLSLDEIPQSLGEISGLDEIPEVLGEEENLSLENCPQSRGADFENALEETSLDSNYREKVKESDGATQEVHHMPAKSVSELSCGDGPAIVMEKDDHRQTASCGNSLEAREYRKQQGELMKEGKFREAVQMDIDDIREKFADKYDAEIADLEKYLDKLESEGKF